jgi:TolA-binding protein
LKSLFFRPVRRTAGCCACLLIIFMTTSLAAGEAEELNFAKKLMRDGMYMAAAEEFLRFAERYPASPDRAEALLGAGEAFMKAGKASEALRVFDEYLGSYPSGSDACKARFYKGRIFKALKRYDEAAGEFVLLAETYAECVLVDAALLEAGDCLLSVGDVTEAASVLRRLVYERRSSDITPRGMLSLAMALERGGRDLEAESILKKITDTYPQSPVAAFALLNLAEKNAKRGDFDAAIECLRKIEKSFEEDALRERASLLAIEIHAGRGNNRSLLDESMRFIERFSTSEKRGEVYATAIRAAWSLGEYERVLNLIDSYAAEEIFDDASGEILLMKAKALAKRGKNREAVAELEHFRYDHARSPLLTEAYELEADLRYRLGDFAYARRLYGLLLIEPIEKRARIAVLQRMAEISASQLDDATGAIRYWRMVIDEELDPQAAESALFALGSLLEGIGDRGGAIEAYRRLQDRFSESPRFVEAEKSRKRLELQSHWTASEVATLARIAASGEDTAHRSMRVGILAIDAAGDAETAIQRLDEALKAGLPDSVRGMAKYKLGAAHLRACEILEASGKTGEGERKKALSLWLDTAREFVRTYWGGRAHRAYLEGHFEDWSNEENIARIEEYLSFYGEGPQRWWALGEQVKVLYDRAQRGDTTALDKALSLSGDIVRGDAPSDIQSEAAVRRGYLFRMRGDVDRAIAAFEDFASRYAGDPKSAPVLYDLGEIHLERRAYGDAARTYEACMQRDPPQGLAERCLLRKSDCLYYMRLFGEAASLYREFVERYPSSDLAGEASYREALALEMVGDDRAAESILDTLYRDEGLSQRVRVKVLRKIGERRLSGGRPSEARQCFEQLIPVERTCENLFLLGRSQHESGDYRGAVETYTATLKFTEVDSCAALSGRARANLGRREFEKAEKDLELLERRCTDSEEIAAAMLEKGIAAAEEGRCEMADSTLGRVRSRFGGTRHAVEALYYLALCDMKRGGYDVAASKLESFLRTAPQSPLAPDAYFKLAGAQFATGNHNLAARNYALAAEAFADPERGYLARFNLGRVYQELEDWNKAAEVWKEISGLYPGHKDAVEVLFNLGFCYNQTGRNQLAYEVYRRIPDIALTEEQRGRAHYWAGISLKSLDRNAEAVGEFLRVPYLRTGGMWGVTSKLEAAACYERMGETEEALKIYRDVVKVHGGQSDWGRVASRAVERITGGKPEGAESSGGGEDRRDGP